MQLFNQFHNIFPEKRNKILEIRASDCSSASAPPKAKSPSAC